MYIEKVDEAKKFTQGLRRRSRLFSGVEVVVAPGFPFVVTVAAALKGSPIKVGAQAVSSFTEAKRTGEVSAPMLKSAGASYVIVGHSERRAQGESDASIRAQLEDAHAAKLTPILCVGETERDPSGAYVSFVEAQLTSALTHLPKTGAPLVVAYEPVWAIGKSAGDAMKGGELREMSIFIRKVLADVFDRKAAMRVPILYGGSVEGGNARSLLTEGDVQGFLVGHASAILDSFVDILKQCKN
jgi:triosephosphate isomerase